METKEGFAYTIKGTKVTFPCKAYPTQLSMMDKIIRGLTRQENSLLESPTGSGKSLALLCSCLAWQRAEYEKQAKIQAEKEKEKAEYDDSCCCKPEATGADSHSSPDLMLVKPQLPHNDAADQRHNGISASCIAVGIACKQESDCDENNKILQDHTYAVEGNPPENDLEDGDFQAPKKRFRTPGFPQPSSRTKKQRLDADNEDEVETGRLPEWTMELNVHVPQEGSGSNGECSPEFKKDTDFKSENLEDIRVPKIYFGTRTHKQIAQITRELGKTAYKHARMCILSSREHSCIHPRVSKGTNKNEECKKLLDGSTGESCRYNQKAFVMSRQSSIRSQGLHSAWDIEDLVALGKKLHACPYYASRELMKEADIVFCPYNYLIDPKIRRQMEIDLTDQVVVLDEGHNVEDSARDAASYSITAIQLQDAMSDLDKMVSLRAQPEQNRALHVMLANILRWMDQNSSHLKETAFEQSSKVWSGMEILTLLEQMGFTQSMFDLFQKTFREVMSAQMDPSKQQDCPKLTSNTVSILEGLLLILAYILSNNHKHVTDYRVALLKTAVMVPDIMAGGWMRARSSRKEWTQSLNFWCMNPAVVFSEISSLVRSLILTSGTLSPMNSFSSELGMAFPIKLEANHVVGRSQVWVGSVGAGPSGAAINACYKSAETFNFQDEVGNLLLEVCKVIPHGVLCFFPSYKMLEKLSQRWQATNVWSELERRKVIVSEPRRGDREEFDDIMQQFYQAIEESETDEDSEDVGHTGGLFLAVCRGKVSEGLDFADNNARAVITVGIPFPNVKDIQVDLKRKYNNQYCSSRGLLNGNEWYEIQAFRALNQALGRCIRHKQDWGAIILVDERFNRSPRYINALSKWVRQRCQNYRSFNSAITSLNQFSRARKFDPCPNGDTSFLASQGGQAACNVTKGPLDLSICSSPVTQVNHVAVTPKNCVTLPSFPDDFNSFCNGFITSQGQKPRFNTSKIQPSTEQHPLNVTPISNSIVATSHVTQIRHPNVATSTNTAFTPLKNTFVAPPTNSTFGEEFLSSTPTGFRDESVKEHIQFSSVASPVSNTGPGKAISKVLHFSPKQLSETKAEEVSSEKSVCSDQVDSSASQVCGFSVVSHTVPTKDFQVLDPTRQDSVPFEENHKTEVIIDEFPDSPDMFAASPFPCDPADEKVKHGSTPRKNASENCHNETKKLPKEEPNLTVMAELKDKAVSHLLTTRNLFRKQTRKTVDPKLETTSRDPNSQSCVSEVKENFPPTGSSSISEMVDVSESDRDHGPNRTKERHDFTKHVLVEKSDEPKPCVKVVSALEESTVAAVDPNPEGNVRPEATPQSYLPPGKEAENPNPPPQKKAQKSNIRHARRTSNRLSTRKSLTSESAWPTTSDQKTKKSKRSTENQKDLEEGVPSQLQCSACGSSLVTGNYKKQKSDSQFLREVRQLYCGKHSVPQSRSHLDVIVHTDNLTSNVKPLTTVDGCCCTTQGMRLNCYFDPESRCFHVPQVCQGCLQKDGPAAAAIIGVQIFPLSSTSISDHGSGDQQESTVWLLHEAVLQPKQKKSRVN